jgi:hypothetical protein
MPKYNQLPVLNRKAVHLISQITIATHRGRLGLVKLKSQFLLTFMDLKLVLLMMAILTHGSTTSEIEELVTFLSMIPFISHSSHLLILPLLSPPIREAKT